VWSSLGPSIDNRSTHAPLVGAVALYDAVASVHTLLEVRMAPNEIEDGMEWNRLTIATVVLGVATLFFLVSGATGSWLPVAICGVLFFIALGMVFRERAAKSRV
jgi:hypothetical protein